MTGKKFERLKRRFGDDIDAWPAPFRQEARMVLAPEREQADMDGDASIDRLVLEAALAGTDEQAIARKVLARIERERQPLFRLSSLAQSWRLSGAAAGFAVVLVAAGIAGYSVAGADLARIDRALLALATGEPAVTDFEIDWPGSAGQGLSEEDLL